MIFTLLYENYMIKNKDYLLLHPSRESFRIWQAGCASFCEKESVFFKLVCSFPLTLPSLYLLAVKFIFIILNWFDFLNVLMKSYDAWFYFCCVGRIGHPLFYFAMVIYLSFFSQTILKVFSPEQNYCLSLASFSNY